MLQRQDINQCCQTGANISEVMKSQRNRRRQRRLQIFPKSSSLENKNKVVDLIAQKPLNDMTLN